MLSRITIESRERIIAAVRSGKRPTKPIKLEDESTGSEVPGLFQHLTNQVSNGHNAHYKQSLIVWYMVYDPDLFARWMLRHESAELQDHFMKALREAQSFLIFGTHMDGTPFKSGDNMLKRRTGHFIGWVRDMFASL